MVHSEVQAALYVIHTLILIIGLRSCWSIRDVPKKFSDFHVLGTGWLISKFLLIVILDSYKINNLFLLIHL